MSKKELIEYRTPNTKHFLNTDGTITVELYKDPVHYLENGVYQEIDNTLVQTKEGFKNKRNDFQVTFTEEKDNALVNISCKDKKLSMFPKNRKLRVSPLSKNLKRSVITYEEMNDEVSLEYKALSNQLKESIILNKKPETNQYVFIINTTLDLVLNEDNTIYMMSKENIDYKIEKPYMVDANQVYSESVTYDLTKIENGYEITITVDKEWLEDKERVYPIIIDPTITSVQSSTSVIDTYIYEGDSEDTTYNKSVLYVGTDKSNKIYRTLLKFTLPKIPAGFKVVEANVSLSCCPDEFGLAYQDVNPLISVHKLTQDWTESGAKWSNMHDKYSPHIEDYFWGSRMDKNNINPNFDYKNSFQLTDLVQRWYNGEPNYGIMLKEYKEVVQEKSRPAFYISKDYNDTSYAKPFLSIVYKNFNGLESYLSYTSQKHDFGSSYVNNNTGNLTTTFHVANTVGSSLPVNLYLVYNTTDVELNTDYGFGLGIKPNLVQTLVKETIEDQEVLKFTDEDGTISDTYDFTEYYENPDNLGEYVNNLGYEMQKNGQLKPYNISMTFEYR